MGGLDWTALPIVVNMMGVRDVELLIHQLQTIRDRNNGK
jgi:hypothetical protein